MKSMSSKEDLNNTRVENNNMRLLGRGKGILGLPKGKDYIILGVFAGIVVVTGYSFWHGEILTGLGVIAVGLTIIGIIYKW